MASPGLSEPKVMEEDARMTRRKKAIAGVTKLKAQASGADKFEDSKGQQAPDSVTNTPAWKRFS